MELDAIACVGARNVFLGWISRRDSNAMLRRLENEELFGKFRSTREFEWEEGGGLCINGMIEVCPLRTDPTDGSKKEMESCASKCGTYAGFLQSSLQQHK